MSEYVDQLAGFAAGLSFEKLPKDVVAKAEVVLLNIAGAVIGGSVEPEHVALFNWSKTEGGTAAQALAMGAAGVALELDEGCAASKGHPGIHVVPAALARGTSRGVSGKDLITAIVAGYEVAARIGAAGTPRAGIHPHGTWGAVGAAVAVAKLEGLDARRMAEAIRIAACLPIATNYNAVYEGKTVRNLWSGVGNLTGTLAADMAAAGYTGPGDAPAQVYGETIGTAFDRTAVAAELGARWLILGNYFKLYSCCRHAHASVDAFRAAVGDRKVKPDDIATIDARTYGRAVASIERFGPPTTPLGAKFSLPYILGVYMARGDLEPDAFRGANLNDAKIAETARKVKVGEDPELSRLLPGTRGARVTVTLKSGETLKGEAMGSIGDPHAPLGATEVREIFLRLATPVLGAAAAEALATRILAIHDEPVVKPLFDFGAGSAKRAAE